MKYIQTGSAAGIVLGAMVLACPMQADAGWGHLRGGSSGGSSGYVTAYGSSGYSSSYGSSGYSASYGSSGYSASYGSSGYTASYGSSGYTAYSSHGSSGGSSGGPGLLQRVAGRIHDHMAAKRARHAARRAAYGSSGYSSYGSSGGSSGYTSYGSSGGYSYGYSTYSGGSSGGSVSYGSTGYSSGISYGSTYYGAANTSTSSAAALVSNVEVSSDAVSLMVAVPSSAKIFVNDNPTTSTGAIRKFVSRGLKAGKEYRFQLRAEMQGADGQVLTEEKTLVVSAGQQEQVQFEFTDSNIPVETAVTLNLPEGAKVLLSGNETKATGTTRTFRTSRLKPGQVWDNYEIEVQMGDQIKRQSVRLIGGDQLQLSFDFEQPVDQVAAR